MSTVGELLNVMAFHLQENPVSFFSGLWSSSELIQYLSGADREFITLTGVVKQVGSVQGVIGQGVYTEPSDCIDLERLSWNGKKLYPQTSFELDRQNPKWQADLGAPRRYHRDRLPPKQFEVWPRPATSTTKYAALGSVGGYGTLRGISGSLTYGTVGTYGVLRQMAGAQTYNVNGAYGTLRGALSGTTNFTVFYDKLPPALTATTDVLTTPTAFCRYVMYRALERAWSKDGDGQDMERAVYCKMRFERGIAIAKRLVYGDESEPHGGQNGANY